MSDPPPDAASALQAQLDALHAEQTRAQLESEQALHDLAAKLSAAEADLARTRDEVQRAQEETQRERTRAEDAERREREAGEQRRGDDAGKEEARRRAEQAEREKADLLAVIDKEQADKRSLEESLNSLRASYSSLQAAHSELEGKLAETSSASRTSLLRVQTLQSTVTSLEADKAFLTQELDRGRAEWSAYRREKHAELVALQGELDTVSIDARAAQSALEQLRAAHEQLKARHADTLGELAAAREERGASEAAFVTEMASMRRLVDLMEKREDERKKRVDDVERALEDERAALQEREAELADQLLQERERADALDARVAELREALERGNAAANGLGAFVRDDSPAGSVASAGGSAFALSPSAQRAVRGQKSGRSYAEIYGEYIRMEEELAHERAETKRLGECLAQILGDIEERAPLLQEQRLEYERLSVEATQLASQLAQALTDRDGSERRAESLRLDVERLGGENTILSQQLSDLGRQVRTLARVLAAHENPALGAADATDEADEEEAAIRRRADELGDTDSVVSAHLVTFRTINDLQVQNQKLLRITREMGARLEQGEQDARARREGEENAAVVEAHELILRLKDEVEAQRARTDAFEKERDMFRRMLSQRGGAGAGEVVGAVAGGAVDGDAARLLAEVQANFDAYRAEMAVDTQRLREDLAQAQKDAAAARTELAKSKAQSEFLAERFRLLTESFELQKGEMSQMSKRALEFQQMAAKTDMASHKMTEDLLELRSTADQLRHENTNLKSERSVLKSVEQRLADENAALSKERAHLADLMRNLQTMQNELERSGNDARRRLEEQVARLEAQAAELKDKLNQESDSNRQLALRKEIESKTFQERIDKLSSDHASTREQLIAAKTSQEHLEQRVRDLVLQVEAKEEKLAIFEGRGAGGEGDANRTVEEQLQVTVADLRNELRTTKAELERAKEHVKQYQAIAETQGESLREVTATYEEYKAATESAIAEKDSEIASLRERLHSLTQDLTTSNTQNSELHKQIEAERVTFEKERKTFEDGMAALRTADQAAREAQLAAQDDLRRQAQLARDAHDKYERELVAHAEDVKKLAEVKEELNVVRATVREHDAAVQVAKANLSNSEESWTRQKGTLEQELADVRKRCDELKEQNSTLAQHLETASSQATQLQARHAAVSDSAAAAGEGGADADTIEAITASHNASVEQLREVIRYLRREKDIIDLQLEFSKQEATRLRQQLDFTSRSLEETRQSLQEERSKAGDSLTSSAQHAELLESIHTAKLLRESNQTLRDESEANLRKVTTLDAQLRQAQGEINPLKEEVRTLQAEVESKAHQIRLLEEDNERWKVRNQTILAKYERIDPEELQVLKAEVDKVQASLTAAQAERDEIAKQLEEKTTLAESMRSNWQNGLERFKALQTQARSTRDERNALMKTVEELKAQIEAGGNSDEVVAAATAQAQAQSQEALAQLQARLAATEGEKAALEARLAEKAPLEARLAELATLETRLAEQETAQGAVVKELQDKLAALEAEKITLAADRDRLVAREEPIFRDNRRMIGEAKARQAELAAAQTELKTLKETIATGDNAAAIEAAVQARVAEAAPPAPAPAAPTEEQIAEAAKEKIAAAEAQFAAQRDEAVANAIKETTLQLQQQIEAIRAELAAAQAAAAESAAAAAAAASAAPADGAPAASAPTGASDEEVKKAVEAAVAESKKQLEADFEKIKSEAAAEAVKKEKETIERLTTALRKAQQQANAAAAAPSSAPPPDIEKLVGEKVAALEKERTAAQQQAIAKAVAEALDRQKKDHDQLLESTKEQIEKQAEMKNNLLQKSVAALRKKLADNGISTGPGARPAPPAPAAGKAASPPAPASAQPAAPAAAQTPAAPAAQQQQQQQQPPAAPANANAGPGRGGAAGGRGAKGGQRGRGGGPGGRGGAAAGRAGKAAGSPPASSPAQAAGSPAAAAGGAAPALTLRGAASAAQRPGGVLGSLLGAAGLAGGQNVGKRARESDGGGAAEGGGDQSKRPKGA
ncbi:Protein mlp1 [Rhodotorula kratochvilovae]